MWFFLGGYKDPMSYTATIKKVNKKLDIWFNYVNELASSKEVKFISMY